VARAQVGADAAFERFGLRGSGSTLCLVDTGVEHAFAPGRLHAVWSASGTPRGHALESLVGGAVFPADALAEAPPDRHGHGTAMASIAVGAEGLAPGARLLVAAAWDTERRGFPDDDVVRGVTFCRQLAASDDAIDERSMVILLSLGGHDGDHGGAGAFERSIVEAAGPVPVVVAAGNDGERAVHATGRVFAGETALVQLRVPRSTLADAAVGLTLELSPWGPDARVRLVGPDSSRSEAIGAAERFTLSGATVTVVARDDASSLTLEALGGTLPSGTWTLEITGSASFDVWLAGVRLGTTFFPASLGGPHVVADETITIPATSPRLIAVGASISRSSVGPLTMNGEPGDVASFSSRGPTSSGVPKPDIVAPGGWILARLSSDVRPGDADNLIGGRSSYLIEESVAVRGSSASAAVVAGALLLALELDPSLGRQARERLVSSTEASGWTPERGFGALNVERLLAHWSGAPIDHRELSSPRPRLGLADPGVWVSARGTGEELVISLDGRRLSAPMSAGSAQLFLHPGLVSAGDLLRIEGTIDGVALPPLEVLVVPDRRGDFGLRGGGHPAGCTVGPPGAQSGPWSALLLVFLLVRRRAADRSY